MPNAKCQSNPVVLLKHTTPTNIKSHTTSFNVLHHQKNPMAIKTHDEEAGNDHQEENRPLLQQPPSDQKNLIQQAISQTFRSTAHLANLLPTGTVLAFQLMSPIFSNQGECDSASRAMTAALIILCGLSCFVFSFSDSYRDDKGSVCYGFATPKGLWVIDGSVGLAPEVASEYRIRVMDFVHAVLSVLVFGAIAMFDGNVVHCFYPEPSVEAGEVLSALPVGIGAMCSMLFVVFPTQRHGIGFPVSAF